MRNCFALFINKEHNLLKKVVELPNLEKIKIHNFSVGMDFSEEKKEKLGLPTKTDMENLFSDGITKELLQKILDLLKKPEET